MTPRSLILFALVACLYLGTGFLQSWNLSLSILNAALLATIAALGVNMQWGYAGLFSVGTMGFTALGGLAVVLVSAKPNVEKAAERPDPRAGCGCSHGRRLLSVPRRL
jgi:branched-chain amino acid transport system permease protein